ncbi:hypothetical protein [Chitinophaga flava]|uniref:Uncharacterized protein n=1 Tax=Chitinophaga flava TaxID=2259036 RepID=A0A365Y0E5_9BACT|nr:hypothetical protein [Chitinophaga flava]RBL92057.1 hypothetical protein DF182_05540 [Chitinophaga flava]
MNEKDARQLGATTALKCILPGVVLLEIMFLVWRSDPFNSIIFILSSQINPVDGILLVAIVLPVWLLGRKAGKDLLIKNKSYPITVVRYTFCLLSLPGSVFSLYTCLLPALMLQTMQC